ncbi:hypothetical protein L1987_47889 [Smallanthus sonchifolius]|uniref:Uncharacterized protein n=1 Tax=Smallanthus sonchifolius TaxID=185202 RepID=A0ACB9FQG9_9ASTR|nr:hypothetical protein L1987_47889 [Smallanthus sonchifolius]
MQCLTGWTSCTVKDNCRSSAQRNRSLCPSRHLDFSSSLSPALFAFDFSSIVFEVKCVSLLMKLIRKF